ncbi:MAG TPA: NlpC/P60 family protein [Pedomonas sp.]|uniref:NlpC/P60 family protein n=1 Tax=Pedomonas sp. TaxID=2976421 RepID=UPI002F3FE6C9
MTTRGEEIAAAARGCVGTPFRLHGRVPGRGLDCVGLVAHVGRSLGLIGHDETGYGLSGSGARLEAGLARAGLVRVNAEAGRDQAGQDQAGQVGDVLLFDLGRGLLHVAVRSEHGIIHAHRGLGRVVEHRLDEEWRAALAAVWRFPAGVPAMGERGHG